MANVSEVSVDIRGVKCGTQLRDYLKAVDHKACYTICPDDEGSQEGDTRYYHGYASGRWGYSINLTGAFGDREDAKRWCSDDKVIRYYDKLVDRLKKEHDAKVEIDWVEAEPGMGFIQTGHADFMYNPATKKVELHYDETGMDYTAENLIRYGFADNEQDAREWYGAQ